MTPRTLMLALFVGGLVAATAGAAPPPGPPWPVNYAQPAKRSANDAPTTHFASAELDRSGAPFGAAINVRAAIAKPKMGGEYELRYQLRLHTKKGEFGPILGTKDSPGGISFTVRRVTCEYDWIEFYETFDVTRKDLNGLTGLPTGLKDDDRDVLIRVEPHLYDVAEKKWLTPAKTPAVVLVASVSTTGRVWELRTISEWLIEKARAGEAKKALATLTDLDEFNPFLNGVLEGFNRILESKDVADGQKLAFIAAVEANQINGKSYYKLRGTLAALSAGPDGELKEAARKKLAEAK